MARSEGRGQTGKRQTVIVKIASLALGLSIAAFAPNAAWAQAADVPYVPTPQNVVEAMLDIAKVGPSDYVIDLGSGDGRIVITAAKKYGARGLGVELDGALVADARREAERQGVKDRAQFAAQNLFITELDRATVITTYLFPRLNLQLRPRIFDLKPGTRVVSHEFDFGNWKPDAQQRVPVPGKRYGPPSSDVYLWIVPANAAGRWQWRIEVDGSAAEYEATLEQTFQMLSGSVRAKSGTVRLESATMRGEEIALVLVAPGKTGEVRHALGGRIAGDTIRGKARIGDKDVEWQATRVTRGTINIDAAAATPALAAGYLGGSR
jgi:hypothetical protein